ncbi:MAG: NAD(P)/FAD-dependent oxidoreductase, partial [Proteobacteria bacterium]|nr:NAD(P)/FAD-dependent oxidoreductase [Pseudomonadota bacterium]
AHVTMLQRSPTYIMSAPARDPIARLLERALPAKLAGNAVRWKNVLLGIGFYAYCRRFPEHARKFLLAQTAEHLGGALPIAPHFTPTYKPWDQRLCLVPDADLFEAIKGGNATVVTDRIETFDETGLALASGTHLDADLVVTATGLALKLFGGIAFEVDGARVELPKAMLYKGMMATGIPNFAFAVGYTNASWTPKCDLASQYVCRLLSFMDAHGFTSCQPVRDPTVDELPLIDFNSGYVARAEHALPHQGTTVPWRLYQNYVRDLWMTRHARLDDAAMKFG